VLVELRFDAHAHRGEVLNVDELVSSDQFVLPAVSITSRPSSVGMRPALNCTPLPFALGGSG